MRVHACMNRRMAARLREICWVLTLEDFEVKELSQIDLFYTGLQAGPGEVQEVLVLDLFFNRCYFLKEFKI